MHRQLSCLVNKCLCFLWENYARLSYTADNVDKSYLNISDNIQTGYISSLYDFAKRH